MYYYPDGGEGTTSNGKNGPSCGEYSGQSIARLHIVDVHGGRAGCYYSRYHPPVHTGLLHTSIREFKKFEPLHTDKKVCSCEIKELVRQLDK